MSLNIRRELKRLIPQRGSSLLMREQLAITLFITILGLLIAFAWVTRGNIDPEVEGKVFVER